MFILKEELPLSAVFNYKTMLPKRSNKHNRAARRALMMYDLDNFSQTLSRRTSYRGSRKAKRAEFRLIGKLKMSDALWNRIYSKKKKKGAATPIAPIV